MKKEIKMLCATAALTCCMVFPSMAAETRAEYKEEAAPIHSEMKSLNEEMAPLRAENKAIAAKYKAIRLDKKNTGTLSIDKADWQKAKELHSQIREIRKGMGDTTVKDLKVQARAAAKEKNFDTALNHLEDALELKKSRQVSVEQINDLWKQIDTFLSIS